MEGEREVSEYELVADVPTCTPALYILYPITPTLSVLAIHDRLIWLEEIALAEGPVGTEGAVVSAANGAGFIDAAKSTQRSLPTDQVMVTLVAPALVDAPALLQALLESMFLISWVVWPDELTAEPLHTISKTRSFTALGMVTDVAVLWLSATA